MFKAVTSKSANGGRSYGYVLLWVGDNKPTYMIRNCMGWFRNKADAVKAASGLNE
jgi:hypothetical protein